MIHTHNAVVDIKFGMKQASITKVCIKKFHRNLQINNIRCVVNLKYWTYNISSVRCQALNASNFVVTCVSYCIFHVDGICNDFHGLHWWLHCTLNTLTEQSDSSMDTIVSVRVCGSYRKEHSYNFLYGKLIQCMGNTLHKDESILFPKSHIVGLNSLCMIIGWENINGMRESLIESDTLNKYYKSV